MERKHINECPILLNTLDTLRVAQTLHANLFETVTLLNLVCQSKWRTEILQVLIQGQRTTASKPVGGSSIVLVGFVYLFESTVSYLKLAAASLRMEGSTILGHKLKQTPVIASAILLIFQIICSTPTTLIFIDESCIGDGDPFVLMFLAAGDLLPMFHWSLYHPCWLLSLSIHCPSRRDGKACMCSCGDICIDILSICEIYT